jgi:hypothetical protein
VRAVSSYRQGCLVFPFEDAPSKGGPVARSSHGIFPPDEQTIAIQRQVPGHRVIPGAIIVLDGAGAGGPEQAGALSLVYATFNDNANAQRGYRRFAASSTTSSRLRGSCGGSPLSTACMALR